MKRTRRISRGKRQRGKRSSKYPKHRRSRMSRRGGVRDQSTKGPILGLPRRSRAKNQRPPRSSALSVPLVPPIPKVPAKSAHPLVPLPTLSPSPESPINYPEKKKNRGKQRVKAFHDLLTDEDKRKADARNKTHNLKKLLGI